MNKLQQTNMFRKDASAGVHRTQPRLNKKLLLPVDRTFATKLCLTHHLSLAACREDAGSDFLMSQLVRSLYMTCFLWRDGFEKASHSCSKMRRAPLRPASTRGAIRAYGAWMPSALKLSARCF